MSQLEGHISPPQGPVIGDMGCGGQHAAPWEPLASLCCPLLPWAPQAFPWCSPITPRPPRALALPAPRLSQGLLPSLLPTRNKSPSGSSLSEETHCHLLPTGPVCHWEAGNLFPDQRGFIWKISQGPSDLLGTNVTPSTLHLSMFPPSRGWKAGLSPWLIY